MYNPLNTDICANIQTIVFCVTVVIVQLKIVSELKRYTHNGCILSSQSWAEVSAYSQCTIII